MGSRSVFHFASFFATSFVSYLKMCAKHFRTSCGHELNATMEALAPHAAQQKEIVTPLGNTFRARKSVGMLSVLLSLCGCASNLDRDNYDKYSDKFSAHQLVDREDFEPIDLVSLIQGQSPPKVTGLTKGEQIDVAFRFFADANRNTGDLGRSRRNEIQERILAASDQRCNDFKNLLQKKFANANFISGIVSTAAAVAASVVNSVEGSKTLAGLAGLTNGYRSEYNQAFFANAAAQVVVAGIDSRRRTAYEQILRVRKEPLSEFPLEAAVKDGIRYHGLCSTVSGLQEAGEAVRYYNEPGITAATRTFARAKMLSDLNSIPAEQVLQKLADWQNAVPAERYLAGNPLGTSFGSAKGEGQSLIDHYIATTASVKKRASEIDAALSGVDVAIVPAAEKTKVMAVLDKLITAIDSNCKPTYQKRAQVMLEVQAQQSVASDANETAQLSLKMTQLQQLSLALKAGLDFVGSAYISRGAALQKAITALGTTPDAGKKIDVTTSLAKFNKLAPQIAGDCEVTALEVP